MSIINKMHQGLQTQRDDAPILSSMPVKKQKKRVLLFTLITLLLAFSIALSYLIYEKRVVDNAHSNSDSDATMPVASTAPIQDDNIDVTPAIVTKPIVTKAIVTKPIVAKPIVTMDSTTAKTSSLQPVSEVEQKATSTPLAKTELPSKIPASLPENPVTVPAPVSSSHKREVPKNRLVKESNISVPKSENPPHLEIKTSVLSAAQFAEIHLKNAQKEQLKGNNTLAAEYKMSALQLQPQLHEVRQALALYFYGIGEQKQAKSLLQQGALQFPEHADFNLMLARIALKNSEPQRAYFYLHQAPPSVKGNMDYHISYAILAQKFKHYEQAEQLYKGLLTERPNNGRWMMSLAIAQDKQGKESLAVQSYQRALLQVDLSSSAKKYINQRLTYLASQ